MNRGGQQRGARSSRPSTALTGSSLGDVFNLSALDDNLPGTTTAGREIAKNKSTSTSQETNCSGGTSTALKKSVRRASVTGSPTISSLVRKTMKKESMSGKTRPVSALGKNTQRQGEGAAVPVRKSALRATNEKEVKADAADLPLDSLCLLVGKLESVYHVVACAAVCRQWREASLSDSVWKSLYQRWWRPLQAENVSDDQGELLAMLPLGFDSWRQAFIAKYKEGKRKVLSEETGHAVKKGWLHVRRMPDRHGKRVKDIATGDAMRRLVERLGLTFHLCVNRDQPLRLKGKGAVVYFPASCLLRYPIKSNNGGLSLKSLIAVKVTATSDRLLRTCTVANFTEHNWEMVSKASASPGPLRLLQQCPESGASLMIGTLIEGLHGTDGANTSDYCQEQALLLIASLHLSDLIWKLMELGQGPTPQIARRVVHSNADPSYGLHGWNASIQLHTFGKCFWSQSFHQVFWNPRESISGERAVFLLLSLHTVFPGMLSLPWRSEFFSGELRGVFMLDFTLWDENFEIAWHCSSAVRTEPATLATVEYGPPGMDGERLHTSVGDEKLGVNVAMNLCIPFNDAWDTTTDNEPLIGITDLRLELSSRFLNLWFGRSTI